MGTYFCAQQTWLPLGVFLSVGWLLLGAVGIA